MEREFIAHHIKEDSGLEHLTASMQSEVLRRSLEALDGAPKLLEDDFRSTRRLQYSATKSSGGLSDPGPRDCAHRIDVRKISDTHKEGRNCNPPRTLLCNPPRTSTL